jgi:hypothetical protein
MTISLLKQERLLFLKEIETLIDDRIIIQNTFDKMARAREMISEELESIQMLQRVKIPCFHQKREGKSLNRFNHLL